MNPFLLAGGGTGGHISPALAVAEALENRLGWSVAIHFAATPRPVDRRMYAGMGERVHFLDPPRIDRGPAGLLKFPFGAVRAWFAARGMIRTISPGAILCTGGYSSVFCAAAGRSMGIPVLLHESNAVAGRANRCSSMFASRILLGFGRAARDFPGGRSTVVGNPVRSSLSVIPKAEAVARMGLDPGRPVVLLLGGSQGARTVNDLALSAPPGIQLVLQCGERDLERIGGLLSGRAGTVVRAFEDDPSILYSCAGIAVARAGAMTLAELCRFRLPGLLIPLPGVSRDHQTANAKEAEAAGGARVFEQDTLDPAGLWASIGHLLSDPGALESMSAGMAGLFPPDTADRIARMLIEASGASA